MYNFCDFEEVFGNNIKVMENSDDYITYKVFNKKGEGFMRVYEVFEGVQLVYNDFNSASCYTEEKMSRNVISINHCYKGRFECKVNNEYIYIDEGDLAISTFKNSILTSNFPLNVYKGYSLLVDVNQVPKLVSEIQDNTLINSNKLVNILLSNNNCYVIRKNETIQNIFTELYFVKPSVRKGYFKLKALEILLYLTSNEDIFKIHNKKYYTSTQVEKVKRIKEHIIEDISKHITINELAHKYSISKTSLKDCFKDVYGESPYAYLKQYRINSATIMLKENKSIGEIAGLVGYQNASKFSKAFKDIKGVSPREYRKS